jgi:hypothetical protein
VALAYTPVIVIQAVRSDRVAQQSGAAARQGATPAPRPESEPRPASRILALGTLLGFIAVLPVLVIWSSFPFGAISAFILFIGMRQAWQMTRPLQIEIYGPYQVGAHSLAQSV